MQGNNDINKMPFSDTLYITRRAFYYDSDMYLNFKDQVAVAWHWP